MGTGKKELNKIGQSIRLDLERNGIVVPKDYCLENAMKHAYLKLKETYDKNRRPALDVCTPKSVHKALLSMTVQGLDPEKNQCYFVVYGQTLKMVRSYMGSQKIAKLVDKRIISIRSILINDGQEDVDIKIVNGLTVISNHNPTLKSRDNPIIGAYCGAYDIHDKLLYSDIMTIKEIETSWKQSKKYVFEKSGELKRDSTHGMFTGEMCRRTVIERLCKYIINSSNDSGLLESSSESDTIVEEIEEKQTRELIDFKEPDKAIEVEELLEPEKKEVEDSPGWY